MKDPVFQLCDVVRETAYAIHEFLGPGHLEIIYQRALIHRLRKQGHTVQDEYPIEVCDEDGTVLGSFAADLLIDGCLIIELKSAKCFADVHIAQLLGYLRASKIEHGLLINFGNSRFEIKKYAMTNPRGPEPQQLPA